MAQIWWQPNLADLGGAPSDLVYTTFGRSAQTFEISQNPMFPADPVALRMKFGGEVDASSTYRWGMAVSEVSGIDVSSLSGDISMYWDFKIVGAYNDAQMMCFVDPTANINGISMAMSRNSDDFAIAVRSWVNNVRTTVCGVSTNADSTSISRGPIRRESEMLKSGNAYYVKVWEQGTAEPASWQASNENFVHPVDSGHLGFMRTRNIYADMDFSLDIFGFGIGTNGDPAPRGPVEQPAERSRSALILTPW